jgi:hypothetical protein
MRLIKLGLPSVAKGAASVDFFEGVVQRLHVAKTMAYLLCKAWMLEAFERGEALPAGQGALESLFHDAVRVVAGARNTVLQKRLGELHETLFPADVRKVDITGAMNWPTYAATRYAIQVVEHLRRCYTRCLERYLALTLGLQGRAHRSELREIVRSVLRKAPNPHVSHEEASRLVPQRALLKGDARYDVKVARTALDYLPCMLHMAKALEEAGERSFAVFPLVSSQVPEAIFLDSNTLLALLPESMLARGRTKKSYAAAWTTHNPNGKRGRASMEAFSDDDWMRKQERLQYGQGLLWDLVLDRSKLPIRGRSWTFANRIQTDGVSITIYAERERAGRAKEPSGEYATYPDEDYVHRLPDEAARAACRGKRIVAIDPGKQNIIFAVEVATDRSLRYTARQRAAETKKARADAREEAFLRQAPPTADGRTVQEWEAWFSTQPPRRTLDVAAFRAHITAFCTYAAATKPFWLKCFHRKERLDAYRRRQRSEARLLRNFEDRFGGPDTTIVAFGDGARNNLSGRAPGPSTAIRRLLQRRGYRVLDVYEAYTSKRCFACKRPDAENGPCRIDQHANGGPRPAWGVRCCCQCLTTWARDRNAALNIDYLARKHIEGLTRPGYLCPVGG